MKNFLATFCLIISTVFLFAIEPDSITIVRDKWGVPHIFAKTDPEVAYGLAWAHAEDDFENIQKNLIAGRGRLAEVEGKDGALFDFALQFFQIDTLVDARYEKDLSAEYRALLDGYAAGINAYAAAFPKEVMLKNIFPVNGKDAVKSYTLSLTLMAGAGMALKAVNDDLVEDFFKPNEVGSNAMAIAPSRTEDGKTWLAVNSHQPIEGRFSWYEAHVSSEQGWNMLGGLFPGGATIFVGTNEHLGWAHTNNYHNFGDIYKLELNPDNKNQYKLDGKWVDFTSRTARLKVKLAGIRIPVKRKVLISAFGPVYKDKKGDHFAFRFPGAMDITAGETWYKMNKSKNINEFESALKTMGLPLFNVVYADREGNIFLQSGGRVAKRDTLLNWALPITTNSSDYLWTDIQPYESLPRYLNPDCGFLYNANNTALHATCPDNNWNGSFPGLQLFGYNRGDRFGRLMNEVEGKFTWNDFIRIKYDKHYDPDGAYYNNFKKLYSLDENKYPELADAIRVLKRWNMNGSADNRQAALAMITNKILSKEVEVPFAYLMIRERPISEEQAVEALGEARKFMLRRYGKLELPLGEVQKLMRGDVRLPVGGLAEVPRACDVKLHSKRKGLYRMYSGDGYIQLIKYSPDGVELQTVNAFGASNKKGSPHYTDQMDMFVNEQTKTMTLDKAEIMKEAARVYSPGR